jgi:putative DNA primase/helicase
LNGIEDVATRGDFIERCIIVYLAPIKEAERLDEARFWSNFEMIKPRIFGAMLNAMVSAIDCADTVHLLRLPRMADFALWAVAAEAGLGFCAGTFLDAYDRNRGNANALALEASPVANPIVDLMAERGKWEGTASALLAEL